ncbi:MAG TPA: saccharopine dehydrogenase NADP-binding domain-containing protein [Frankiaceae bacterium]|jgi:short subunit dehydrogenase-like uncharacterized protein|nr:saccharopine dehydrogenase NADP-binding domain-containing protein [Frankiaceae bacterium]
MASSSRRAALADRTYDVVLVGATGFTGGLTAEYLARHAPVGMRWALAGRNRGKLEAVRDRLSTLLTETGGVDLLDVDVTEESSVLRVAESARVLITTVGPYLHHGEPFVAACAAAGTDYVDLTGESEFVDRMFLAHHETAERTGARIVHACGFDSIPHDLGAQFTVEQLPEDVPIDLHGYVSTSARPSGGSFASTVAAMSRLRQASAAHRERRAADPAPTGGRRVGSGAARPGYDKRIGRWVLPMPTVDPQIVLRSAAVLERYGPDFRYSHLVSFKNPAFAAATVGGVGAFVAIAQLPPARPLLLKALPSGKGPSPEQIEKSWFRVRFVGEGGGRRVETEVRGGDPGYGETSKMLAESALCLAFDDLPQTAGMVTTAVAMGPVLRERLVANGIDFSVISAR